MDNKDTVTAGFQSNYDGDTAAGHLVASYPSTGRAWWVVFVLLCCYTLSFIDRTILALMVGPIKADLHINDFWFAQLTGTAFAVLYSFLGVPIGILADSSNRKRIIAIGIGIWSVMTALSGTARSFAALFMYRIGVGMGEAALSPCAYSMVADSFPKEKRAWPMGAYSMGTYVGAGIAMIFGGIIAQYIIGLGPMTWPVLGEVRPWQVIFFVVALPAIPVLLLMLTIREPKRQDLAAGQVDHKVDFRATMRYMADRWQLFTLTILGISILAFISYAVFAWYIEFFIRIHHWERATAGLTFGLIVLFCGAGGMFTAGLISDRLLARGHSDAPLRTARYSAMVLILPLIVAPIVPNPYVTVALLIPGVFALGFHVGLGPSALQAVTPNNMRGQVIAIYLLLLNLIAQIGGQSTPAFLNNYIFDDEMMLGTSLSITCGGAALAAILLLTAAAKRMRAHQEAHDV